VINIKKMMVTILGTTNENESDIQLEFISVFKKQELIEFLKLTVEHLEKEEKKLNLDKIHLN